MTHLLVLDQGTTSSRALIIDKNGSIVSMAQKEFRQIFPQPSWVEHDPAEIWLSQRWAAQEALKRAALPAKQIAAIGIANQRESVVVWDRLTGVPVCPCIVWQDRRTMDLCHVLKRQGVEPLFRKKTGLLLDPYFSGTKIRWMLENIPGVYERACKGELAFGTIDTWLIWNLTKGQYHLTDVTNASRTLMYNIHTGEWDDELLEFLGIPRLLLPRVNRSSQYYANTHPELFGASIPITGVAGDQQAALFGHGCLSAGETKTTYGTGCFMLMHTGNTPITSEHHLLTTPACTNKSTRQYALEGSIFVGGAIVHWLKDSLGIIKNAADIEELALSVPDSGGVYFVPALTGLGAPHWNPNAKGMIAGLTRGTTAAHIARAALDSIAFQVSDMLEVMQAESKIPLKQIKVDGGVTVNNFLMQFQADLAGVRVIRPQQTEMTGLGAAYLAGLSTGFWKSTEDIQELRKADQIFYPNASSESFKQLKMHWKDTLKCVQMWSRWENSDEA